MRQCNSRHSIRILDASAFNSLRVPFPGGTCATPWEKLHNRALSHPRWVYMTTNEQPGMTRRRVITGLGAGLAGLATSPGFFSAEHPSKSETAGAPQLDDPKSKYPK